MSGLLGALFKMEGWQKSAGPNSGCAGLAAQLQRIKERVKNLLITAFIQNLNQFRIVYQSGFYMRNYTFNFNARVFENNITYFYTAGIKLNKLIAYKPKIGVECLKLI